MTCVLASMAITGWLLRMPVLAALSSENIPMAPSTVICFLIVPVAIFLQASRYNGEKLQYILSALLLTVALFCGIVFLQYAASLPLDIESVLFQKAEFKGGIPLGRMSPLTSAVLLLAALAALLLTESFKSSQKVRNLGSMLGLTIGFTGFAIFLGYVYGSPIIYRAHFIPVAISTSLAFMLLGTGIVAAAGPESLPLRWF